MKSKNFSFQNHSGIHLSAKYVGEVISSWATRYIS